MPGMVIQHNMNAMNATNRLNINVLGTKKSTEKLSSGYKINRAADNAAGLAISEKMRAQIRGLAQAINNTNDGISLIQTAEGGLNETHAILQRMRELAVQSANGTYQDFDRQAMQLEVDRLQDEIDRIAQSTEYNRIKLLDGSLSGMDFSVKSSYGPRYGAFLTANTDAGAPGIGLITTNFTLEGSLISSNITGVTISLRGGASGIGGENAQWSANGKTLVINLFNGMTYSQADIDALIKNATQAKNTVQTNPPATVSFTLKNGMFSFVGDENFTTETGRRADTLPVAGNLQPFLINGGTLATEKYADTIKLTSNNYGPDVREITILTDVPQGEEKVETDQKNDEALGIKNGVFTLHLATGNEYTAAQIQQFLAKAGLDYTVELSSSTNPDGDITFFANTSVTTGGVQLALQGGLGVGADKALGTGKGLTFQIGANGVADQRVTLSVDAMDSIALGVRGSSVSLQDDANKAIELYDAAINTVSMQRAALGALQNRLEYTVNNLTVTEENLTSAESQIRDTDMATEMVNYTKFSILQQAAQAMLAQANQQPQAVLQLLR